MTNVSIKINNKNLITRVRIGDLMKTPDQLLLVIYNVYDNPKGVNLLDVVTANVVTSGFVSVDELNDYLIDKNYRVIKNIEIKEG